MSLYHLHARRFEGPLAKPRRDERESSESDDWQEIDDLAKRLSARGFTVWIYDHGHEAPLSSASDLRVVAHLDPHGGGKLRAHSRNRSPADPPASTPGASGSVLARRESA